MGISYNYVIKSPKMWEYGKAMLFDFQKEKNVYIKKKLYRVMV